MKQPKIEIGGQNADFEGHYVPRNSPKFKKEGVMNDSQKLPEIQNLESFLQNVHLYDPHAPL